MSKFNQPLGGNEMPRYAGPGTMFRLPTVGSADGLDIALVGVPLDIGTSNRTGTRFGPRQIRNESVMVRPYCMATGAAPFDSFQVADVGDVALNSYNLLKSIDIIEAFYDDIVSQRAKPVSIGGDHTITLPILRALSEVTTAPLATVARRVAEANAVEQRAPRIEFQPRIWMLPLRTLTMPPATHTNVWMPGGGSFVVIDPGSADGDEIERLLEVVERWLPDPDEA